MPQGQKSEVVVQHQPTEQVIPQLLPIPQRAQSNEAQPSGRDESREVPLLLTCQAYAKLMSWGQSTKLVSQPNLEWILRLARRTPMLISSIWWQQLGDI